jgi:hypothetical protein
VLVNVGDLLLRYHCDDRVHGTHDAPSATTTHARRAIGNDIDACKQRRFNDKDACNSCSQVNDSDAHDDSDTARTVFYF